MTADPSIVAAYRSAFARLGMTVEVTFTRITGVAPHKVPVSATVRAVVRNFMPNTTEVEQTGIADSKLGAISQGDRQMIVMAVDLAAKNFPLPLQKNDKVTLPSGEELTVTAVDAYTRAAADAIELKATGVN